ncbi:MAG: hypothetical protein ABIO16_04670 [Nocardioides sp.]
MTRASGHHVPVLLDLLGRRVRVDAGGHPATAQVEALWSRCRPSTTEDTAPPTGMGEPPTVITLQRSDRPMSPQTSADVRDRLRDVAREAADGTLLLLRAAAVATPGGAVLGLVAESPELRASVAAELSRRGFGYVTDELLALDEAFGVVPFPEPLGFEQEGEDPTVLAGPDALGLRPCADVLRLAAMVVVEHDPGRSAPELVRVDRAVDVRLLEPSVVVAPSAWADTALPDLVDEVDGLWLLTYGEVQDVAPLLADLLVERTRPASGPIELYVAVGLGEEVGARPPRISWHDLALDGLRRTVWESAVGGATLEGLHTAANLELGGPHHISVQLVAAAVRDLMGLGLLVPETGRPQVQLANGSLAGRR